MINLEPICSKYGHQMIQENFTNTTITEQENVVTRALGVLAENGIYAMCIYLLSCNKKKYGKHVLISTLQSLWFEDGIGLLRGETTTRSGQLLENVRQITEVLPKLILARKITEQALTFARYHAKANIAENSRE